MKMNVKKTTTIVITKATIKPTVVIKTDGNRIEQVDKFQYLGQLITEDGSIETAGVAFTKMEKVLTSRRVSLTTRKRLLKCYVYSTFMYGCETWTMTKQIRSFQNVLLHKNDENKHHK